MRLTASRKGVEWGKKGFPKTTRFSYLIEIALAYHQLTVSSPSTHQSLED
jgi:hypothetical protein